MPKGKTNRKRKGKETPSVSVPKKFQDNKKLKSKTVQEFLGKQFEGATDAYKSKLFTYIDIYSRTQPNLKQAVKKAKREVTIKRDNRLEFVKKRKDGIKVWKDTKTGERITGGKVRKLMFDSIRVKTIETLALKSKTSYDVAEKLYREKVAKQYNKLKNQKQFKQKIAEWKKQGLTKKQLQDRIERVAKGKAEIFLVRKINQS